MTTVYLHRTPNKNHKTFESNTERLSYLSGLTLRQRMIAQQLKKDVDAGHTVVIPLSNVTAYGKGFIDQITHDLKVPVLTLEPVFEQHLRQEQTQLIHVEKYKVVFGTNAILTSGIYSEFWTTVYLVEPIIYVSSIAQLMGRVRGPDSIVRVFYDLNESNSVTSINAALTAAKQIGYDQADSILQRIELQDIEDAIHESEVYNYA